MAALPNFEIKTVFDRLRTFMQNYPKAAMFQLADEGYCSAFEQLVSCIISIRTYDETSLPVSRRLFARANTPQAMSELSVEEIETLIKESTFSDRKAIQISELATEIVKVHHGELPCDLDVMSGFRGVGPKCAHLALGIACQQPYVSVDIHVHRVINRWGLVATKTPEKTAQALMDNTLPQTYWIETNQLLMPFGKHICKQRPQCDRCPIADQCAKVGV
ncbi:MAG: endonuclease III domain-containing protein [Leptolyngbyaceae cyanobacterium]